MITIWMMYFLAAMATSGIFIVAGWHSKHARDKAGARRWQGLPFDPLWNEADPDLDSSGGPAASDSGDAGWGDVSIAIRLALKRLAPVMATQSVQAEIACPSGLMVRMKSPALADLVQELLTASIHEAPDCRLLLTATRYGESVQIGITDAMPGADLAIRVGGIRGLMERVALRGGSLDVNVRPGEGTTTTLRLAAAGENSELPVQVENWLPAPVEL